MKALILSIVLELALLSACGSPGPGIAGLLTPGPATQAPADPGPTKTQPADIPARSIVTLATTITPARGPSAPATTRDTLPAAGRIRADLPGKLAFTRNGDIYAYYPQTGKIDLLIQDGRDMQFSPDGTQIVFVRDDGLYLAALDGGSVRRIVEHTGIGDPQWSDDGSKIAFERIPDDTWPPRGEIWTTEAAQGIARKIADGTDPAWSPDNQQLAYAIAATRAANFQGQIGVIDWQGQRKPIGIDSAPKSVPAIGIPGYKFTPEGNIPADPVWDSDGQSIYMSSFVLNDRHTSFGLWQRIDLAAGRSTFLGEARDIAGAIAAPNREAAILTAADGWDGQKWLEVRLLDPTVDPGKYTWAEFLKQDFSVAAAWAPNSDALAFLHRPFGNWDHWQLVVLAPGQSEPTVLIPNVAPYAEEFAHQGNEGQFLAWGR